MMRSALVVFCVFCVGTLLTETLGLALLWHRGLLTSATLHDIRLVLAGRTLDEPDPAERAAPTAPSRDEVVAARVTRLFNLGTREDELEQIKAMLNQRADELTAQGQALEQQKLAFSKALQQLDETAQTEAAEQARGVLRAMQPPDAVASLMPLSLEENVRLLAGMPEKSLAKILKEFLQGNDQQAERGREIFEAVSRGEPKKSLIDAARAQLAGNETPPN